jgi:hypothetical protein
MVQLKRAKNKEIFNYEQADSDELQLQDECNLIWRYAWKAALKQNNIEMESGIFPLKIVSSEEIANSAAKA